MKRVANFDSPGTVATNSPLSTIAVLSNGWTMQCGVGVIYTPYFSECGLGLLRSKPAHAEHSQVIL